MSLEDGISEKVVCEFADPFTNKKRIAMRGNPFLFYVGHDPVEHVSVRNINNPLCGCAVFVIQKNHLSVIILDVQA